MKPTAKTYTRIENWGEFLKITDVNSEGSYYQRAVWPDGVVTGEYRTTLQDMGWASLHDFLAHRKGFKLTGC